MISISGDVPLIFPGFLCAVFTPQLPTKSQAAQSLRAAAIAAASGGASGAALVAAGFQGTDQQLPLGRIKGPTEIWGSGNLNKHRETIGKPWENGGLMGFYGMLPSGNDKQFAERSTIFNGLIHYFHGHI